MSVVLVRSFFCGLKFSYVECVKFKNFSMWNM